MIGVPIGRLGGAGIVHRGRDTQRCDSISYCFHEPIAGGAEQEPESQDEGGAGGGQRALDTGPTSVDGKRCLQHRHLFLQGRGIRPTQSESMPPSHGLYPSR
jgi:hypothetical protein